MGFEMLLGNDRLKENLRAASEKGRFSHFYLISGSAGSGKRTLARLLSAAAVCRETQKPCLRCNACRKAMADAHPDIFTLTDPEHKEVPVKLVRQMRADIFVRPNEADKKVCILPQELRVEGYNALLKILEEPPAYAMFIMLTDNPEKILTTIRSRATELALQPLSDTLLQQLLSKDHPDLDSQSITAAVRRSGGYLGQAKALLEAQEQESSQTKAFAEGYAGRNSLELLRLLTTMEKWKRDRLLPELQQWELLLQEALVSRSGGQEASNLARKIAAGRSAAELLRGVQELQKAMEYTQGNVSVAAICGHLEWALR